MVAVVCMRICLTMSKKSITLVFQTYLVCLGAHFQKFSTKFNTWTHDSLQQDLMESKITCPTHMTHLITPCTSQEMPHAHALSRLEMPHLLSLALMVLTDNIIGSCWLYIANAIKQLFYQVTHIFYCYFTYHSCILNPLAF